MVSKSESNRRRACCLGLPCDMCPGKNQIYFLFLVMFYHLNELLVTFQTIEAVRLSQRKLKRAQWILYGIWIQLFCSLWLLTNTSIKPFDLFHLRILCTEGMNIIYMQNFFSHIM